MEVLGTKNGRNKSIEGHKENSRGVYATVRKKKDEEYYERDSLYVLITAIKAVFWLLLLKRYLTEKSNKCSIKVSLKARSRFFLENPDFSGNNVKASGRTIQPWHKINTAKKETELTFCLWKTSAGLSKFHSKSCGYLYFSRSFIARKC